MREAIFQESTLPYYTNWITLKSDNFIVLSDCESPGYDAKVLNMVCWMGSELGIEDLILGGDIIANDTWSKWAKMTRTAVSYREELGPTIDLVNKFRRIYERIKWITGNHERRFAYQCDGELTVGDLIQSETDVEFSEYAHCDVESCTGRIRVMHQDNYSKVPLSVPYEIASNQLCHVACTHTHRLALGMDRSNSFQIAECGHGRSVEQTPYINLRQNRMPKWNHGFLLVMGGAFQIVNRYNFESIMKQGVVRPEPTQPEVDQKYIDLAKRLAAIGKEVPNDVRSESA